MKHKWNGNVRLNIWHQKFQYTTIFDWTTYSNKPVSVCSSLFFFRSLGPLRCKSLQERWKHLPKSHSGIWYQTLQTLAFQACQRKVKRKVKGPFPPLNESGQIKLDHFPKCENKQYLKPPPLKYTGDTVFPMVWTKMRLETIWKPGQKQFLISLTPLSWKISSVKLDSNKKYSQSPTNLAKWNYVSPDIKDFSLLNHHFWGEVLWCSLWGC